ncbi:MAG TPA: hypothetical protein VNA57_12220 [Acidimicrobiales bacterium]|nr:hypothetical protein [Acidimicrobiales bacterium]
MKMTRLALAGAALAAFGMLAPADAANKNSGGGEVNPCGDDGKITWSPAKLWPPNHKAQTITFTYSDPDAGDKTLTITANPHNEIVDGEEVNGTGNTPSATDSTGGNGMASGTDSAVAYGSARSERSGHKNAAGGRVYEFDYTATNNEDGDAAPEDGCMSSPAVAGDGMKVFVPHDCRNGGCRPS